VEELGKHCFKNRIFYKFSLIILKYTGKLRKVKTFLASISIAASKTALIQILPKTGEVSRLKR
jgi:hypothetical protein